MSGGKRNYSKERKKRNKWKGLEKVVGTDKRKVRVQRVGETGVKIQTRDKGILVELENVPENYRDK